MNNIMLQMIKEKKTVEKNENKKQEDTEKEFI